MTARQGLRGLLAVLFSTALSACYSHLNQPPAAAPAQANYNLEQIVSNIEYTGENWPQPLHADLYLPQKGGPRPVVITVHGGGWANRSRGDMDSIGNKLVRRGYAVFNISYRFAPRFTFPAQLHDLEQALTWIAANADRYRLDTGRINTWGYSSGAHLAALVASRSGTSGNAPDMDELPRIRAVVAGGIPADLRKYPQSSIINRFIGGSSEEMASAWFDASPVSHVSPDDPPVFIYHGKLDLMVGADQATDYYATLRDSGVDAELYLHNWFGHFAMFLLGGGAEDIAINFLDRKNSELATADLR